MTQPATRAGRAEQQATRASRAWDVLGGVLDPEVPALSVRDLGIVRDVIDHGDELEVVLTPTYSGCPATEVIEQSCLAAINAEGLGPVRATLQRSPAWTTDWITQEGRRKLNDYGIAPPGPAMPEAEQPIRVFGRRREPDVACPRCASLHTEKLAAFSSTACKAMYRCLSCREPFEHFKPI
ncbi:phenylacetate-CoA oxygenase subunit PaaJ [Caenimonas koreensis DSM 17982]|uniref:Phenylacetate-CoA oxygenase subunit PaaJ n=1 Tax=Caenimonas koreensis DSM 17982 TaxID=1121255 RepID=A0A844BEV1_9BURK|nr:1,2-phenylacetyl-CoA epoxidase subunit PaaD [Caenimonas koreensis]MRD48981.1 phenylacetate-CoA oxygenase subunit PaaJ [Caenimonas koreensis DSM 17982]